MSSSLFLTQKNQIHCPWCYQNVKCHGGLASHIWQSLICWAKHDNHNLTQPRTSHGSAQNPPCLQDAPPNTGHGSDGDWNQDDEDLGPSLSPECNLESEANVTDNRGSPPTPHLKVNIDTDAGKPLEGHQETLWEKLGRQAEEGWPYVPFESKEEWELSYWLSTEGLSQGAIDHFQKLKWVSHTVL